MPTKTANRALNELELLLGEPGRPHIHVVRVDLRDKAHRITVLRNKAAILERGLQEILAGGPVISTAQGALHTAARHEA